MSELSKQLSKYYLQRNNNLLFEDKFTLTKLSHEMSRRLASKKVDKSVISRVIKGERLFTVAQLEIFCEILGIAEHDKQKLFRALQEDYLRKKSSTNSSFFNSSLIDKVDIVEDLTNEAFLTFYDGRCRPSLRLLTLINEYLNQLSSIQLPDSYLQKRDELLGLSLYLQGRIIGCIALPQTVIHEITQLSNKMIFLAKQSKNNKILAYANISLADAYYIAGAHSRDKTKKIFYKKSIDYSKKALTLLHDNDHNKILALRNIAASAVYLEDRETFIRLEKIAANMIKKQPQENLVYTLQFCSTIATGGALFNIQEPFALKNKAIDHFTAGLQRHGAFEVSDIRAETEALSLIGTSDKKYIESLVIKGSIMAQEEDMTRYIEYFEEMKNNIYSD